ncbi:cytochrome b/b6 domain-containing protein [Maritimibacter sp. UBA3975]|uniref:cytochrome b/b6 domain-containing protein n=1 Tax=Maritimibacter sp. UBA3975 TaxID=1946833 RepID=UPI000C093F0C|nr:cytochrome b/b6 domain-containing protein [Maritimibacter sp. UBA3975]MAM63762.1 hypothetical protein [Maritimibacter sp.]|tara:strand:+ start:10925 stop:11758 length:834 start_codon:yes stop_codon:yes gene_type:complete
MTASAEHTPATGGDRVYRHRTGTRLWHWTTVLTFVVMLMSGLMIFNAHPRLYWGQYGANPDYAWMEIGNDDRRGYLRVGNIDVTTTGVLGINNTQDGELTARAFPWWSTIPSNYNLARARLWHLTFAWVLALTMTAYLIGTLFGRHRRDLLPAKGEARPGHIWRDIKDHARLRFPRGEAAARYNILQKLTYLTVLLVLFPGMILTGLTMSPNLNAKLPFLLDLFGGRQSARSLHFIFAFGLVGFVVIHLVMVVLAGPINEVRSMLTGWFRLPKEKDQ